MIPKQGECQLGVTRRELRDIFGTELADFDAWMSGQTGAICEGRLYNHETGTYHESCGGVAHGYVVYRHDVERYLRGLPVVD